MRTPEQAIEWARQQHYNPSQGWTGLCQMFVRSAYGLGGGFASASAQWRGAQHRHRTSDGNKAPRGVAFCWTGGSRGFGHIVLSVGNGLCWSTDVVRTGHVDLVRINEITQRWGQHPEGWIEDVNGTRIWHPPVRQGISVRDLQNAAKRDPGRHFHGKTPGAYWDVLRFERMLARAGAMSWGYVDGSYGTMTRQAVREFQRHHDMNVTGNPYQHTVERLNEATGRKYKIEK